MPRFRFIPKPISATFKLDSSNRQGDKMKSIQLSIAAVAIAVMALLVPKAANTDVLFHTDFAEPSTIMGQVGQSPVSGAVVELRSPEGELLAETVSDEEGRYRIPLDSEFGPGPWLLIAYGGFQDQVSFAEEYRAIYHVGDPLRHAHITPAGTVLALLAGEAFFGGSDLLEQRELAEAAFVATAGLKPGDWRSLLSERLANDSLAQAFREDSTQDLAIRIGLDLQAGQLAPERTEFFPEAHGGIAETRFELILFPGTAGVAQIEILNRLGPDREYQVELLSAPLEFTANEDGSIAYDLPADAQPGLVAIEYRITDVATGGQWNGQGEVTILDGEELVSGQLGPDGGELVAGDGSVRIVLAAGATTQPLDFSLVRSTQEDGSKIFWVHYDQSVEIDPIFELVFEEAGPDSAERGFSEDTYLLTFPWSDHTGRQASVSMARWPNFTSTSRLVTLNRHGIPSPNRVDGTVSVPGELRPVTEDWVASKLFGSCIGSACSGKRPIVFVHGYQTRGQFGGGPEYWSDFPALLASYPSPGNSENAVFDFRYRSNARFEDVAGDLAKAIAAIRSETGRNVVIIAHSFGGLVARTYLQGQAQSNRQPEPYVGNVQSLITIGTPHSGVRASPGIVDSVRLPAGEKTGALLDFFGGIGTCQQLSCYQAGQASVLTYIQSPETVSRDYRWLLGLDGTQGYLVTRLSRTNQHPLTVPMHVILGKTTKRPLWRIVGDPRRFFRDGDGLISYGGQRAHPSLACPDASCSHQRIGSPPAGNLAQSSNMHRHSEQFCPTKLLCPICELWCSVTGIPAES